MPPKLSITPKGDEAIALDGAQLIPEEMDGSGNAISLGTITDDKNESGDAVYRLAEGDDATGTDNSDFRITNNVLFYKGAAVDFESATKKSFNIKIIRYKNAEDAEAERSPQTLDSTINLQDQIEVLGITPPGDASPIFSDGASLLQENADGSTNRIELGAISDNIKTTLSVSYRLADASASNNNGDFQIENGILYYIGTNSGDFDAGDFLMVDVIRTLDGNAATEQTLQRTINLKDIAPDITTTEADGTTEIPYLAMGEVGMAGTVGDDNYRMANYRMVFEVEAEDETLTIDFVKNTSSSAPLFLVINPQTDTLTDGTKKVTGFEFSYRTTGSFTWGENGMLGALTNKGLGAAFDTTTGDDLVVWQSYTKSIEYLGTLANSIINDTLSGSSTLEVAGRGIVIDENTPTTTILANFAATDTATWSLTGIDALDFNINPNTGEFRFENSPDYENPDDADEDNQYSITINADDGTTTVTYKLLVVVADVAGNADTTPPASSSAAENIPSAEESVAEATPEAEATKPSIGRRILDYLFGSQEEHRQMQNQQIENMFSGDSDLDPLNPQDPDIL